MAPPVRSSRRSCMQSKAPFGSSMNLSFSAHGIALPSLRKVQSDSDFHRLCRMIHHLRFYSDQAAWESGLAVRVGTNPTRIRAEVYVAVRKQPLIKRFTLPKQGQAPCQVLRRDGQGT